MRGNAQVAALWMVVVSALVLAGGCSRPAPPAAVSVRWLAGHTAPGFDPDGPPDPLRAALERALSRGLVERDSAGAVRGIAAERIETSADGLAVTFTLRPGLRFTDGTPATSTDFRDALVAGLARQDHATQAWRLAALTGVERVRAGRPLPALGIATPDAHTLVLHLAHPDSLLLGKLAGSGVGVPWRRRGGAWADAVGLGPYRVAAEEPGRALTLVRSDSLAPVRAGADSVFVRFAVGAPRVLSALRHGAADVVWPLPPGLSGQPLPPAYAPGALQAAPPRRLLLVLRADVPPTTKLPARHALVHALNRADLLAALGMRPADAEAWLAGAGPFDAPRLDAGEVRDWLARGKLGASFHVVLGYDADGDGAEVARALQGQWSALGLYAELRPLRGEAALAEPLKATSAQALLLEAQAPLPGAGAELATLVMPLRGPAVGSFRTGWRTREFDRWLGGGTAAGPLDAAAAQARLEEERIALPIAVLPWRWLARGTPPGIAFWPETGLELAPAPGPAPTPPGRRNSPR